MAAVCSSKAKSDKEPPFICIHPQCGACGQLFLPGDHIVALLFRNSACLVYNACKFTAKGYAQQSDRVDITFYKIPDSPMVIGPDESITTHTDCFKLCHQAFTRNKRDSQYSGNPKEDLRRLWLAATWRYAWNRMTPLKLPSHGALADPSPGLISKLCGFKKDFLSEIALAVQSFSQSSILWRLDATLQLAEELSFAKADETVTTSLSNVVCWSRDNPPVFVQDEELVDPFVCLIVDSRGIKSITRLSELSAALATQTSIYPNVLIIEPVETIKSVDIEFRLGRSRLHIPMAANFNVWSAPLPVPNFLNIKNRERHDSATSSSVSWPSHFVATNLDPQYCTGLSFFLTAAPGSKIIGIYGHSHRDSPHLDLFEYVRSFHGCRLFWIYVPIAANDKIQAIGVRRSGPLREPHSINLMMTSGQYTIGMPPTHAQVFETLYIAGRQHATLIHSSPLIKGIPVIKADTRYQFVDRGIQSNDPRIAQCSSSASLEHVLNAHVFTDEFSGLCKGILIEYKNGLKRSLGQCRLGMDYVHTYENPSRLSYASTYRPTCQTHSVPLKGAHVVFDYQDQVFFEEEGLIWEHYEMKGDLHFVFSMHEVHLKVSLE